MINEKELLRQKKSSLLLTRITYSGAALNLGAAITQMQNVNANLSINPRVIDIIAMGLSGLVFVGGLYHANNLKFDIDELEPPQEVKER